MLGLLGQNASLIGEGCHCLINYTSSTSISYVWVIQHQPFRRQVKKNQTASKSKVHDGCYYSQTTETQTLC